MTKDIPLSSHLGLTAFIVFAITGAWWMLPLDWDDISGELYTLK